MGRIITKFKLGDRVRVLPDGRSSSGIKYAGKIGIVIRLLEGVGVLLDIDKSGNGCWNNEVELAIGDWDD